MVIDVEPDGRQTLDVAEGWKGSSDALEHLTRLRGELEKTTGAAVRFNWFLRADPQIQRTWGRADWIAEACPRILRTIEAHDDYCGIHVHMWRWSVRRQEWFSDLSDASWVDECVTTSIDAFKSMFGRAPEANRFGDRWMNDDALEVLKREGIRYDLSVEPGLPHAPIHDDPLATAWLPDFRGLPREPYVPRKADYRTRVVPGGRDDLWIIPLTTTSIGWRTVRRPPFIVRASRSPNLSLSHKYVWRLMRSDLDRPSHAPLVVVVRSGDLVNRSFLGNFLRTTRELVRHPALAFCEFTTPPEAVSRFREAGR